MGLFGIFGKKENNLTISSESGRNRLPLDVIREIKKDIAYFDNYFKDQTFNYELKNDLEKVSFYTLNNNLIFKLINYLNLEIKDSLQNRNYIEKYSDDFYKFSKYYIKEIEKRKKEFENFAKKRIDRNPNLDVVLKLYNQLMERLEILLADLKNSKFDNYKFILSVFSQIRMSEEIKKRALKGKSFTSFNEFVKFLYSEEFSTDQVLFFRRVFYKLEDDIRHLNDSYRVFRETLLKNL